MSALCDHCHHLMGHHSDYGFCAECSRNRHKSGMLDSFCAPALRHELVRAELQRAGVVSTPTTVPSELAREHARQVSDLQLEINRLKTENQRLREAHEQDEKHIKHLRIHLAQAGGVNASLRNEAHRMVARVTAILNGDPVDEHSDADDE